MPNDVLSPDRRQLLAMLGAGGALAATGAFAQAPAAPSLAVLAAAKGLRFGSAAGVRKGGLHDPHISALLVQECSLIVPENELKMYVTHPAADVYDFAPGDDILSFAQSNHMAMRGHNLLWAKDKYMPKWLQDYDFGAKPKVAAEALLRDYIARVTEHYGTQLVSWDVINETVDEKSGLIRDNVFTRILGMDALRICFEAAREHLPHMQLVYNDYMCWEAGDEAHRQGVLTLLRWFRDHKVPVDALGVQSHIGTDHDLTTGQTAAWTSFLDAAVGMGYSLLVTEFDVNDRKIAGDIVQRDKVVAQVAKDYLDLILSYRQVKDVLCWGLDDKYSWLQSTTPREDKSPLRPTPYDDQFRPKPLRDAIAAAFQAAPVR